MKLKSYKIKEGENKGLIIISNDINFNPYDIYKNDNIVTGSYLRVLFNPIENNNNNNLKRELIFFVNENINKKNINNFECIFINKTPITILDYFKSIKVYKRIVFYKGDYYCDKEFLKIIKREYINLPDPFINLFPDPLKVIKINNEKIKMLFDKCDLINISLLSEKEIINTSINNLSLIEYSIYLYKNEKNKLVKERLSIIIKYLNKFNFLRPVEYYNKDNDILSINYLMLSDFIDNNEFDKFKKYLKVYNITIDKKIIELVCLKQYKIFYNYLINKIDKNLKIYLILMFEKYLNSLYEIKDLKEIDINKYLEEIIVNGKFKSFRFLYELNKDIINTKFSNDNNIIHIIKNNGNYKGILDFVLQKDNNLINQINNDGKTPLMVHYNNIDIFTYITKNYLFNFNIKDKEGNNILHILVINNCIENLLNILKFIKININELNNNNESLTILSCKNGNNNIFNILMSFNPDLNIKDVHNNTVYHYICLNSMIVNFEILESVNNYGFKPSDYSKIKSLYKFN